MITVAKLIKELQAMPQDLPVVFLHPAVNALSLELGLELATVACEVSELDTFYSRVYDQLVTVNSDESPNAIHVVAIY